MSYVIENSLAVLVENNDNNCGNMLASNVPAAEQIEIPQFVSLLNSSAPLSRFWIPSYQKFGFMSQFLHLVDYLSKAGPTRSIDIRKVFPDRRLMKDHNTVQANWVPFYLKNFPEGHKKLLYKMKKPGSNTLYIATEITAEEFSRLRLPIRPAEATNFDQLFGRIALQPRWHGAETQIERTIEFCLELCRASKNQIFTASHVEAFIRVGRANGQMHLPEPSSLATDNLHLTARAKQLFKCFSFAGIKFWCQRNRPVHYLWEPPSLEVEQHGREFFDTLCSIDGIPFEQFDAAYADFQSKPKRAPAARRRKSLKPPPVQQIHFPQLSFEEIFNAVVPPEHLSVAPIIESSEQYVQHNGLRYVVDRNVYMNVASYVSPTQPIAGLTCVPLSAASEWFEHLSSTSPVYGANHHVEYVENLLSGEACLLFGSNVPQGAVVSMFRSEQIADPIDQLLLEIDFN